MKILFVIDSVVPFGPNDLLAYKAAEELLRFGHQVLVDSLGSNSRNAPEYERIRKEGALLAMRDRHERSDRFLVRQLEKMRHRLTDPLTDWRFAKEFYPDAIIVSDPGTYHFLSVPGLVEFLTRVMFRTSPSRNIMMRILISVSTLTVRRAPFSQNPAGVFSSRAEISRLRDGSFVVISLRRSLFTIRPTLLNGVIFLIPSP